MQSLAATESATGTLDATWAGDCDQAYVFGRQSRWNATASAAQLARDQLHA
jgi:uncharacterized protein YukE